MKMIIGGMVAVGVIVVGWYIWGVNNHKVDDSMMPEEDVSSDEAVMEEEVQNTEDDQVMSTGEASMMDEGDRYVEYTKENFEKSVDMRRVLFFYASWCPTCRPVDEDLREKFASIPQDMRVIRINYNDTDTDAEEKALADKYGVTYQHTFVQIDDQGNVVTKWNGGKTEDLLKNIQ